MNIIQKYITQNDCYKKNVWIRPKGLMLHSVGCPQPRAEVFINRWDKPNVKKSVHGFIEADGDVYITLPCLEYNSKVMRSWHCGDDANSTHVSFEMTEPSTIKYNGNKWIDNNPAETKKFVLGTYNTAVELFAYLCEFYGFDPLQDGVILSHSEGAKRGIASNHGDVEHIWNAFGLTMNQFRQDVYDRMEDNQMTQEKFNEMMNNYLIELAKLPPSDWSAEARNFCESNGIITGDDKGNKMYKKFCTREELASIILKCSKLLGK